MRFAPGPTKYPPDKTQLLGSEVGMPVMNPDVTLPSVTPERLAPDKLRPVKIWLLRFTLPALTPGPIK